MTIVRRIHACAALSSITGSIISLPAFSQEPVFRRVAVHGDQAPGTPQGVTFFNTFFETNFPSPPLIDDAGGVSFHAVLTGPGIDPSIGGNADTLYKHVGDSLTLIARQSEHAPGTAAGVLFRGFLLGLFPQAALIANGRTAFLGSLTGPGVSQNNENGVWTDRSGALQLFIRKGDAVPGGPVGAVLDGPPLTILSPSGVITFNGKFALPGQSSGPNDEAIWSDRSGSIARIVGGSDAAPGTAQGVIFGQSTMFAIDGAFRGWDVDAADRVAFHANLSGSGIDDLNDEGIWLDRPGGFQLLIREGDSAPGFAPGGRIGIVSGIDAFGEDFPLDLNPAGQILFMARVDPPGQSSFSRVAYVQRGQGIELVAETRDSSAAEPGPQAPGLPAGMYFFDFGWGNLSSTGRVVLVAGTTNQGGSITGSGIWWDQPGPLTLVAANDMQVPGFEDGVEYLGDFRIGPLTGDGILLFAAVIGGPSFPNAEVIFLTDPTGTPHAVLMAGQLIDTAQKGAPPELRTLSDFLVGAMNESGEVAFKALFNDDSIAVMTVALSTACPFVVGDANGDSLLNGLDVSAFVAFFLQVGQPGGQFCAADMNLDGIVDQLDVELFVTAILSA